MKRLLTFVGEFLICVVILAAIIGGLIVLLKIKDQYDAPKVTKVVVERLAAARTCVDDLKKALDNSHKAIEIANACIIREQQYLVTLKNEKVCR